MAHMGTIFFARMIFERASAVFIADESLKSEMRQRRACVCVCFGYVFFVDLFIQAHNLFVLISPFFDSQTENDEPHIHTRSYNCKRSEEKIDKIYWCSILFCCLLDFRNENRIGDKTFFITRLLDIVFISRSNVKECYAAVTSHAIELNFSRETK